MELGPEGIGSTPSAGSIRARASTASSSVMRLRGLTAAEIRRLYERQVSLRQFVDAEDVANTVYFLASPQGQDDLGPDHRRGRSHGITLELAQ
ncbi:MAG: hypothetical protein IPJ97_02915 [Proteobacteria bacterium]|nr:hypothetical protein [Pseudomonadota bacterium]